MLWVWAYGEVHRPGPVQQAVSFLPNWKQLEEAELNAGRWFRKKIVFVKMEVIMELRA